MNNSPATGIDQLVATAPPGTLAPFPKIVPWLVIGLLLVLQYVLFHEYARREVVWSYAPNHDQCGYLTTSYETYEQILHQGLWSGIKQSLARPIANGMLLHTQASLLYLVLGPSRLSALTLNFAYFALFQIALVGTLRWYSGRWSVAFLGLGLLLTAKTPFFGAGGIMDFRIDFIAVCLFGTFICAVVRSGVFQSWPWSLAVGALAALLVLFRFLATTYLVGILGLYFGVVCFQLWFYRRNPVDRLRFRAQLGKLVLAGLVFTAITLPVVVFKWPAIHSYYITHLHNGEAEIRAREFGFEGSATQLLYYPRSLLLEHAGPTFLKLGGILLLAALLLGRWRFWSDRPKTEQAAPVGLTPLVFALLCLVVPLAILKSYGSPSPVVGGVGVGALLWVVLLAALWLLQLPRAGGNKVVTWGMVTLAVVGMLTGVGMQAKALGEHTQFGARRAASEEFVRMYDLIGDHCRHMGWIAPRISVNTIDGRLHAFHVEILAYEHQGVLIHPTQLLGIGLAAISEADALAMVQQSEFVILYKNGASNVSPYPFNQSMPELYPKMQAACEQTHIPLHRFCVLDEDVVVYARPAPRANAATEDQ